MGIYHKIVNTSRHDWEGKEGVEMRKILFKAKRIDNGEWVISGNIIQLMDDGIEEVFMPGGGEKSACEYDKTITY